jgi:hypothetical protein
VLPKHLLQFSRLHITSLLKNEPQQIDIGPVLVDRRRLPQTLDLAQIQLPLLADETAIETMRSIQKLHPTAAAGSVFGVQRLTGYRGR